MRVGPLRLTVGPPRAIPVGEVGVFDVEFAEEVAGGTRDGNHPSRLRAQQRRHELGGEGEVAEVVGPELELEPVGGLVR